MFLLDLCPCINNNQSPLIFYALSENLCTKMLYFMCNLLLVCQFLQTQHNICRTFHHQLHIILYVYLHLYIILCLSLSYLFLFVHHSVYIVTLYCQFGYQQKEYSLIHSLAYIWQLCIFHSNSIAFMGAYHLFNIHEQG